MILKNMEKFSNHTLIIDHTPDYPSGKRYLCEEVSIPEIIKRAPFLDGDEIKALKKYPEKFFTNPRMARSMSKESLIFSYLPVFRYLYCIPDTKDYHRRGIKIAAQIN